MCFIARGRPLILSKGLPLFYVRRLSSQGCFIVLVLLAIFCLVSPCLTDRGFAADASVKAKANPSGTGKLAISSGKNGKAGFQNAGGKNGISPKDVLKNNLAPKSSAKSAFPKKQIKQETKTGSTWQFGSGKHSKKAALEPWQRGLTSETLRKRAIADRKDPLPEVTEEEMLVNPLFSKGKKKSAFSLGFEHEGSSWNSGPSVNMHNPGEDYLMEGRNVIRGTKSVEAGKNLNIDLGPELILKDQKVRESMSNSNQPDSLLGVGMKFKFGF